MILSIWKYLDIMASKLPQSKFYLIENTNILITSNIAEGIIKSTYIFNNIVLISKLRVIKALSKSDMVII